VRTLLTSILFITLAGTAFAQGPPGRGGPPPPKTPKDAAPVDFTGYWVSVVTEDWRWRMVTPIKGDFASIPLTPEGRRVGLLWDPAKDEAAGEACRAYGAAAIMRVPGRLHITWQDDRTLKIETDSGTQTRLLHFPLTRSANSGSTVSAVEPSTGSGQAAAPPAPAKPGWQGYSVARWEQPVRGTGTPLPGLGATRQGTGGRSLEVVTTQLRPGYLRKNGAPYSANAVVSEYYDLSKERNGDIWFVVTTIVDDPQYLAEPFVTSTNFRKQADSTGWAPMPCTAR
jgi:hypothetical protein